MCGCNIENVLCFVRVYSRSICDKETYYEEVGVCDYFYSCVAAQTSAEEQD